MSRHILGILCLACSSMLWAATAGAHHKSAVEAGIVVWTHSTDLEVDRARDFDGSDETTRERMKEWDMLGSGLGLRVGYEFPTWVKIYGEVGAAQATVRDRDLADADLDVTSRGLDEGVYYGMGVRLGNEIPGSDVFWNAGIGMRGVSTELDEEFGRRWDYDETSFGFDGKLGTMIHGFGMYGGLRATQYDGELRETDLTNPIAEQVRETELDRDTAVDLLFGAETHGPAWSGFAELGLIGTTSATAGISLRF